MNDMSKPVRKSRSAFPECVGNKAQWTLFCTREQLDDEMNVSSIVTRLMENLSARAKEPDFNEAESGEIEQVGDLIDWLFHKLWCSGSKVREQIKELEPEASA
jgi:hypothetical protein